jgi:FkbM family methyltransferase
MKIVYDFGANNGSNIPYYLLKFDRVVAIEANPELTNKICKDYSKYIKEGRLFVENCAVSNKNAVIDFYIHKYNNVLSQLPKPDNVDDFTVVSIASIKPSEIIKKYGDAEYVKIDVEHSDAEIISEIFSSGIFPKYISAEVHDISVFSLLTSTNMYNLFKLLDGKSVCDIYKNFSISGKSYSFPFHSAGPMFDDIKQNPLNKTELFYELSTVGLGWKDIHAKRSE